MNKGKIVQVLGPVVDVLFEHNNLPDIKDALEVDNAEKRCVMEVAQHIGNDTVRCIMLASSEGLYRGMEVIATGSGIKVPVGDATLGRLFNVLGETIDGGEDLEDAPGGRFTGTRRPLRTRALLWRCWRPESKSSICWPPMPRAERSACSAEPEWVRPF